MAGQQGLIKRRRALSDLYKKGVEVRFGGRYGEDGEIALNPANQKREGEFQDEKGKPIPIKDGEVQLWVQPPSPTQRDMAVRDANAARNRAILRAKREEDSEEHLEALQFIEQMSEETLYDYVLIGEQDERRQDALREILAEEEWADITELQESMRIFEEEERPADDPEVIAVKEREDLLTEQVMERERELRDAAYDVMKMKGHEAAKRKAIERRSEINGSRAFMVEYERKMKFYSIRDFDDHGVIFFESATEMGNQPDEFIALIDEALKPFISDGAEAKNSPRAESGSESSDLPSKPETSDSSTQTESTE